ncbi:UNVERIFIED_CONTAM: hypothetical protein NY100_29165, partial [Prevotella sp. 15_C9]
MTSGATMKLFVFGLGYSAGFVARSLAAEGATIAATVRSQPKSEPWSGQRYSMHLFAGSARDPDVASALS